MSFPFRVSLGFAPRRPNVLDRPPFPPHFRSFRGHLAASGVTAAYRPQEIADFSGRTLDSLKNRRLK
jgi:hypothetical protein